MELASLVVASRMDADMRATDVTANNLANASTPGFKAMHPAFADWLDPQGASAAPHTGATIAFSQMVPSWRDADPGTLSHTGNPLDLALSGGGYFTVNTPRGPRLTRDGRFGLLPNGTIANASGDPLLDVRGQPITVGVADTDLAVSGDGTLSSENGQLARIGIVQPDDPAALTAEGATLFRANTPTAPTTQPRIVQGAVEESTVQAVGEVTRMIAGYRRFQFLSQFVQAEGDRQNAAIDKLLAPQQAS